MHVFYDDNPQEFLRFGDVVRGFIVTEFNLKQPVFGADTQDYFYRTESKIPGYCAVLTPCCSIGESAMLLLTPLKPILRDFIKNPYFVEDLTRINRLMKAEESMPPDRWSQLQVAERLRRQAAGQAFASLSHFIYEGHALLKKYPLRGADVGHYMIDFQDILTVRCQMIKRPEAMGTDDQPIVKSKVLQLSVAARADLRAKISHYFYRPPAEDVVAME
jgi:hypothetical protein